MAKYKGTGILTLKALLRERGDVAMERYLSLLTPEERKTFDTVVAITWVPIALATSLSVKAARVLYPGDEQALRTLGEARAHHTVKGVYRVFFRIFSVPGVIRQTAKLWHALHDEGRGWVEHEEGTKQASVCVAGYPSLSVEFHELINGYIKATMEIAGGKNVVVLSPALNDPALWKWRVRWE